MPIRKMNDSIDVVPSENGNAVQIQLWEQDGFDKLYKSRGNGKLGQVLDELRGRKPISSIIDKTTDRPEHFQFIRHYFTRGLDSDENFREIDLNNRVALYRRLSERAKEKFLMSLPPDVRASVVSIVKTIPNELAFVGMKKGLPEDVIREINTFGVGDTNKKTGGRGRKTRRRKTTKSRKIHRR